MDSRAEPWSFAERRAHRLLREAGITGWKANVAVPLAGGGNYFLDIAIEELMLAVEIDGREHHGAEKFESDRWRQNEIVLQDWCIQRFPADTVLYHEALFLHQLDRAIEHCRTRRIARGRIA